MGPTMSRGLELRDSLEYIARTSQMLLDGTHPRPRVAAYLLEVHSRLVWRHFHEADS
jgi:hypothetical protein